MNPVAASALRVRATSAAATRSEYGRRMDDRLIARLIAAGRVLFGLLCLGAPKLLLRADAEATPGAARSSSSHSAVVRCSSARASAPSTWSMCSERDRMVAKRGSRPHSGSPRASRNRRHCPSL